MQDVDAFVQNYTAASRTHIAYAGTLDPLAPLVAHDYDFLGKDDPNMAFRTSVIEYLFRETYWYDGLMPAASNELLHDLYVSEMDFAVNHFSSGPRELALEILRREMYETFSHAYTLRLGQDQGMPLSAALFRRTQECGSDEPGRSVLVALDARLMTETDSRARANLQHWQRWVGTDGTKPRS